MLRDIYIAIDYLDALSPVNKALVISLFSLALVYLFAFI